MISTDNCLQNKNVSIINKTSNAVMFFNMHVSILNITLWTTVIVWKLFQYYGYVLN